MASSSTAHPSSSDCPCKRAPLSLSSATSAEYGDVVSLARRIRNSSSSSAWASSRIGDDGGITPLHLAAQHGHAGAVSLLLGETGRDVDTGLDDGGAGRGGGATPLHRASFSGAISSMRVLLSWGAADDDGGDDDERDDGGGVVRRRRRHRRRRADLLARDASYGDLGTPLHKAVAGGRPLAVQLLLREMRRRGILGEALRAADASGATPLDSARARASMAPDVASVRRWDAVAGGTGADWPKCLRLLEGAAADVGRDGALSSETTVTNYKVQTAFDEFPDDVGNVYDCDAACRDGRCRSVVWEDAFRIALASSIDISPKGDGVGGGTTADGGKMKTVDLVQNNENDNNVEVPVISDDGFSSSRPKTAIIMQKRPTDKRELASSDKFSSSLTAVVEKSDGLSSSEKMTAMGRRCDSCGVQSTTLFRLMANSQLVCRQCRRGRVRI